MKILKTYRKTFGKYTVNLTSNTREGSNSSNIKVWISLEGHLVSVTTQTSVVLTPELIDAKLDKEWEDFLRLDNEKEYRACDY